MTGIVVFCLVFFSHMAQMICYYMLKIVPKIQSSTNDGENHDWLFACYLPHTFLCYLNMCIICDDLADWV